MGGWVVFVVLAVPVLAVVLWLVFDDSIVRILPGELGLVLVNGTPTDRALRPGLRFVPTVRRMAVQVYPAFELAYRASAHFHGAPVVDGLEQHGPRVSTALGDRAEVGVSYTVRFRLDPNQLSQVHQRFGPAGLFSLVRDVSADEVRKVLNEPDTGVADVFGTARDELASRVGRSVTERLQRDGFDVSFFSLDEIDLGRTGESVQAAVRSIWDLERERAEREMRQERARTDAGLAPLLDAASHDLALRYREADAWRDLSHAYALQTGALAPPGLRRSSGSADALDPEHPRVDDGDTPAEA